MLCTGEVSKMRSEANLREFNNFKSYYNCKHLFI
jgi:hypothetical protein